MHDSLNWGKMMRSVVMSRVNRALAQTIMWRFRVRWAATRGKEGHLISLVRDPM